MKKGKYVFLVVASVFGIAAFNILNVKNENITVHNVYKGETVGPYGIDKAKICLGISGGGFKVNYNTNGGNTLTSDSVCVGCDPSIAPELPIPKKEGYRFVGWYYDSALTKAVGGEKTSSVAPVFEYDENGCHIGYKNVTLYAKWAIDGIIAYKCFTISGGGFKVNYNTNGGNKLESNSVCVGCDPSIAPVLPTPEKEGYTFVGWYYDAAFTKAVGGEKTSSVIHVPEYNEDGCHAGYEDVTLYAKWTTDNLEDKVMCGGGIDGGGFKVNYDTNGGNKLESNSVCVGCDSSIAPVLPTPKKEGYIFVGWYYDADFTMAVAGEKTSNIVHLFKFDEEGCHIGYEDVTLYAKWAIDNEIMICAGGIDGGSFKINYNTNGGNTLEGITVPIAAGPDSYKDLATPKKEGYMFAGWYYDASLTKPVGGLSTINVEAIRKYDEDGCHIGYEDVTLYAKWVEAKLEHICIDLVGGGFKVNYNTNGGNTLASDSVCIGCNPELAAKLPIPKRDGYSFEGWYFDKELTQKIDGTTVNSVPKLRYKDENGCLGRYLDATIYAKWVKEIEKENVIVISVDDSLDDVSEIKVETIEETETIKEKLEKETTNFVAYEINLLDNKGEFIQPNGRVKLKLPIPTGVDKEKVAVYRVSDKEVIDYKTTVIGDSVEIETDHFSTYVVGEKIAVDNPETSDNILIYFAVAVVLISSSLVVMKKLKHTK